jgi:beta-1,2-mannobiose phosphorylase / 1,2-beta-oligomannan phosphorylase
LLKLTRFEGNPIIAPRQERPWELRGTFNPGTITDDGDLHILYRAVDENKVSRLAYARSSNGTEILERSQEPLIEPSEVWEEFGCEDPRITRLDGRFYITYTAYSRRGPRIALASTNNFERFEKLGLIGPDRNDKDCVIFPERVGGKIAMLHRLRSRVQIAYFDNISDLSNSRDFWRDYLDHMDDYEVIRSKFPWEQRKVGVGPPPIKTDHGWLVIYHGVSSDKVYRAGAMLLDLENPAKVLARTKEPILEPQMQFEKQGAVPNVVFPDGLAVIDGTLSVYYGGADAVCCVASAPFDQFLDELDRLN